MNRLLGLIIASCTIMMASNKNAGVAQQYPQGVSCQIYNSREEGARIYLLNPDDKIVDLYDGYQVCLPGVLFPDQNAVNAFKASIRRAARDERISKILFSWRRHGTYHKGGGTYYMVKDMMGSMRTGHRDYDQLTQLLAEHPFKLVVRGNPIPSYVLECLALVSDQSFVCHSPFTNRKLNMESKNPRVIAGDISDEDDLPAYQDVVQGAASKS